MKKFLISIFIILIFIISAILWLYLVGLNKILNSTYAVNYIKNTVKQTLNLDIEIKNPSIKTYLSPEMELGVDYLSLKKDQIELVNLVDFDLAFSFKDIFKKQIKINQLKAKTLIIKADKLLENIKTENNNQEFDWKFSIYNADLRLDDLEVTYLQPNGCLIELILRDITIDDDGTMKTLGFNSDIYVYRKNKLFFEVVSSTLDEIKVYEDEIKIEKLRVLVNSSRLLLNASINLKNAEIEAISDVFYLEDIFKIVQSNLIIPNGEELLKPLVNPKGNVTFDVFSKNGDLSGEVLVNHTKACIKDVTNIPITISKGKIAIEKDKINFVDLIGFWGKNKSNNINIKGSIKDYYKSFDSDVVVDTIITNEFFKNYLAPLIYNNVLYTTKPINTKVIYKAKNNIMDIIWLARVDKGVVFGLDKSFKGLIDYQRVVKGEFHIENDKIDIKSLNYYMEKEHKKGIIPEPIFVISGKMNIFGQIKEASFAFSRKMPCELLNIFMGQNLFKKGTVQGNAKIEFKKNIPYLTADFEIEKTLIPSLRMFIKEAKLKTNPQHIVVSSKGGFKRTRYELDGLIKNELQLPITVDEIKLLIDKIDVKNFLVSANSENKEQTMTNIETEDDIVQDNYMPDLSFVNVKHANLIINNGNWNELTFGNINADMSLIDNILKIKSNRFDIAQGYSGLQAECDLNNLKYDLKLGVKDIDSNLMAKTLFNLDKEISGKASGLMHLYTDKTMKLNGDIKFFIKEGTIGKIGLVEYILKIASLFRNPIVMVNPAIIMDIISVPEGRFDKITGELNIKNNVVNKIDIKSYSNTLSVLIRGRFDMERHDASMRIYTRFSNQKKSRFGFLRKISLSTLANKIRMNSKNDENYYSMELKDLPQIDTEEEKTQIFLTQIEGDIENNNFISTLKKIK